MIMPLFTIITAVYNNEKYILSAIESVLQQSFDDFEYIIVDDGSTDATPEIIEKIAARDHRIKIIHQKNQWIFASLNNGIRAAAGEYVFIVNSDDRLRKNILKTAADKIIQYHKPDVIWTKVLRHKCDANQNILSYDYKKTNLTFREDIYLSNKECVRNKWMMLYESELAQNQINFYKRSIMLEHPFRNDIYGADAFFNIDIASDIHTALIMKEPAYDFLNYNSADMNVSVKKYYGYEHQMFNELFDKYKALYVHWGKYHDEIKYKLCKKRLRYLTHEIRALTYKNCTLSAEGKIREILLYMLDETVITCAEETDSREELESRVLSGIREIFNIESLSPDSSMYFAYELLESLLRYEKDSKDFEKIRNAIHHPLNPQHIGNCFYEKLVQ